MHFSILFYFFFRLWGHSKSWTENDQYEFAPNNKSYIVDLQKVILFINFIFFYIILYQNKSLTTQSIFTRYTTTRFSFLFLFFVFLKTIKNVVKWACQLIFVIEIMSYASLNYIVIAYIYISHIYKCKQLVQTCLSVILKLPLVQFYCFRDFFV